MTKATTNSKLTFNEVDFFLQIFIYFAVHGLLLRSMGSRLMGSRP